MKKNRFFLILLCLCLLLQPLTLTVSAEETEAYTEPTVAELEPAATEPAFGTVCVKQGCRTIDGMTPLAGSDRKVSTAQSAFLYEINTDTDRKSVV